MSRRDEVREQIEDIIHQFLHRKLNVDQLCESILALDGIAIVDQQAEMPPFDLTATTASGEGGEDDNSL